MNLYTLNYDLRKQRNYQPLYDELAKFNAVRVLESCWCFRRTGTSASGLRDHFKQFIDADDGLFVAETSESNWATWNALKSPNDLK